MLFVVFFGVEQEFVFGELFFDDDMEIGMEIWFKIFIYIKFVVVKFVSRGLVCFIVRYGEWVEQQGLYVYKIVLVGLMILVSFLLIDGVFFFDIVMFNFDKVFLIQEILGLWLFVGKDFEVVWIFIIYVVDFIVISLW